jgi:hypothetical protein
MDKSTKNNLSWLEVEKAVLEEIGWLKNNILPYQPNKNLLDYSDDLFYRLIAILIVSGKVKVLEYSYINQDKSGLSDLDKKHGSDWHDGMINYLAELFSQKGYIIDKSEPKLFYGHADLKIKKNSFIFYFEVDTINIFKLYINLFMMKNTQITILTFNKVIKFVL